jgi:hypothetical protein
LDTAERHASPAEGAGPDGETMTIDMDSTICEVHGHAKQGAAYGYTKRLGYHPLVATVAATGEVLHARLRKGSSQRGHKRFIEELIARVRRAGAPAALCVRADGGFWSHERASAACIYSAGRGGRNNDLSSSGRRPWNCRNRDVSTATRRRERFTKERDER